MDPFPSRPSPDLLTLPSATRSFENFGLCFPASGLQARGMTQERAIGSRSPAINRRGAELPRLLMVK
ncbi:Hypothetical predicted protein [Podarcis lilfordi]|uniref:Uncharacterized protein n=1 Tax=Podarcis lilfordi TaxID=74358 RepID=A0AA35JRD3_9SAUR|nr:Hypothetical predicted protein [Podarcis lilfordi]